MKTTFSKTFAREAVEERVSLKLRNGCRNYQEYEAYEDHVDSFVLNYQNDDAITTTSSILQGFARRAILRRVRNKLSHQAYSCSYGEYLYGDHVDSPAYDDYPDSFYNDNE